MGVRKGQGRLTVPKIILSLLFFTVLWAAVTDAWGISFLLFGPERTVWQKFAYDIMCRIVWILPVFYLFRRYGTDLPLRLEDQFRNKVDAKLFLIFFTLFTLYALVVMFVGFGHFRINPSFALVRETVFYLVVGLVEELVYRGWAMNAFSAFMSERKANLYAALFFVALHWPAYIIRYFVTGTFLGIQLLQQSVLVLVMGLLFGYMFRKNKSIWTPLLLHAYFDWVVALLGT